jgi:hypothetical protein
MAPPGANDSEAIIKPARTQMAQATATAAILLAERIVVPSNPCLPNGCCSELQHQLKCKRRFRDKGLKIR